MFSTNLFYDSILNTILFDENFIGIDNSDSYLYIACENLSNVFEAKNFFNVTKDISKIKRLLIFENIVDSGDLKNNEYTLDIFDEILNGTHGHALDDIESLLNKFKLEYSHNYESMVVKGCSQGDSAQILVNKKEFKDIMGVEFIADEHVANFTNLFYNSQIGGDITIEFNYKICNHLGIHTPLKQYRVVYSYDYISNDAYELDINIDYILKQLPKHVTDDLRVKLTNELKALDYKSVCHV